MKHGDWLSLPFLRSSGIPYRRRRRADYSIAFPLLKRVFQLHWNRIDRREHLTMLDSIRGVPCNFRHRSNHVWWVKFAECDANIGLPEPQSNRLLFFFFVFFFFLE